MPDWTDGGPMSWQVSDSDTEPGNPTGNKAIIAPAFRPETFFADFEKWLRNLYRCTNWHKCVNVDLLDNKHASDLQLTVASGSAIDSPNLVEGSAIDITTSSSDITIAVDINELTSATVANGDEVAIADVDDSNALKKVTALSIAQLATGGDVSGPSSATDNAIARFDGTTGKLIQNSSATIDDSGNIAAPNLRNKLHYPPGQQAANLTAVAANSEGVTYFVYLGRARSAITTASILCRVTTAYSAGEGSPYAEVGIFSGDPELNDAADMTRHGYTDVSSTFNSTGIKETVVSLSSVSAGDHLWAAFATFANGGTNFQLRGCLADDLQSGQFVSIATQLSAITAGTASTLRAATDVPPWIAIEW